MKNIYKYLFLLLFWITMFSTNIFAFQNGEWLTIENYEERMNFYVDRGEICEYLVKLYNYMTWEKVEPTENIFEDIDIENNSYVIDVYSLGIVGGTSLTTFSPQDKITRGQLAQMIYNLVHKMYPDLDMGGGEEIVFPDYVEDWNVKALQFVYSRGIMPCMEENKICAFDLVTLKEAALLLDNTMRKDPDKYTVIYPKLNFKWAYLTFDDATSNNTYLILDTLKRYNIQATFFITGRADANLLSRMKDDGHIIGNHTFTHDYSKIYTNTRGFWEDFSKEADYIEGCIGYKPTLMRFPGGSNNTVSNRYGGAGLMDILVKEATQYGYTYFDWNVDSEDATGSNIPTEKIVKNVLNGAKNKKDAIILMHQCQGKETTAQALPEMIEGLKNMGFSFRTLSENSYCIKFKK